MPGKDYSISDLSTNLAIESEIMAIDKGLLATIKLTISNNSIAHFVRN